jgi:hypothetical protein
MALGILLDSSVIIPHLRGRFDIATVAPPQWPLFMPLIGMGELYKGGTRGQVQLTI